MILERLWRDFVLAISQIEILNIHQPEYSGFYVT